MSVSSLAYVGGYRPYKDQSMNRINLFNEYCTLIVSYWIMVINGVCVTAD